MQIYSCIFWHIQTNLSISRHIHRHIQNPVTLAYLEPWYIQNQQPIQSHGIFRTLVYSELWYVPNPGIFRTLVYQEPWHVKNPVKQLRWSVFPKIVNVYNYFHNISVPSSKFQVPSSLIKNEGIFHGFRGLLSQNTSFYICSNSKQVFLC